MEKLIPDFLNPTARLRYLVIDIGEHKLTNSLFVAI